jgi:putative lipoic acid-binding regulatory protein
MRELNDIEKNEGQGFQFPGSFEITAMGNANANLRERTSREGNYVSVSVVFTCPSREKYEAAHAALRADPDIRYTL